MKRCTKCLELKPLIAFTKDSSQKSGVHSRCKDCNRIISKEWNLRNREKRARVAAAWRKRILEKDPGYEQRQSARMYSAHRDKRKSEKRDLYHRDPDHFRALSRKHRAADPEYHKQYQKRFRMLFPEKRKSLESARRARKAMSGGRHTAEEWTCLKEYFGHSCAYCLRHESECGTLARDHVVPLVSGGSDDIENIVPSCRPCNSTKNAKSLLGFVVYRRDLSVLAA